MSNTQPTTRAELKEYIKMQLGCPVLQMNLDDSQFDLAIDDAFQYFYERQHFDAIEKVYLSVEVQKPLKEWLRTGKVNPVTQTADQQRYAAGMVDTMTIASAGTGYAPTTGHSGLVVTNTTGGTGSGLMVSVDEPRTADGGLVSVTIYSTGTGYTVGDVVTIVGGNNDATFTISTVKTSSPLYGIEAVKTQNNYLIMPEGVIGVNRVLSRKGFSEVAGGIIPGVAFFNPFLAGGMGGVGQVGGLHYDLTSYYTMRQYISTLQWTLHPPKGFSYNKRTRRLFLNTDNFDGQIAVGDWVVIECDIKANPDFYPDVYNDMFVKRLATAYARRLWGRVLNKYNNVALPGGIVLNGDHFIEEAQKEIDEIYERFMLDYGDYALDMVG